MNKKQIKELNKIFKSYPEIKLVYFFGSKADKKDGPLSDYDFAVYFNEKDEIKLFDLKFELVSKISRLLKTDKVDLVILNTAQSPDLKYNIIKDGKLIFEKEPYKILIEPKILSEYFDFNIMLKKYGLTKQND